MSNGRLRPDTCEDQTPNSATYAQLSRIQEARWRFRCILYNNPTRRKTKKQLAGLELLPKNLSPKPLIRRMLLEATTLANAQQIGAALGVK